MELGTYVFALIAIASRSIAAFTSSTEKPSSSTPAEIVDLFHSNNSALAKSVAKAPLLGDEVPTNQFAEGSARNRDILEKISNTNDVNILMGREHVTEKKMNYTFQGDVTPTVHGSKLNDTHNNSILGDIFNYTEAPTTDTKLSKISARKGVTNLYSVTDDLENNLLSKCLVADKKTCFSVTDLQPFTNFDCNCCNQSKENDHYDIHKSPVNCSSCFFNASVSHVRDCSTICCKNMTADNILKGNVTSVLKTDTAQFSTTSTHFNASSTVVKRPGVNIQDSVNTLKTVTNKTDLSSVKNIHFKPRVTKVPDDFDDLHVSNYKSEKAIVIPIVVSMLIMPLIIILIVFIYKRSREYWDTRHYKRMDFLIDGIYND